MLLNRGDGTLRSQGSTTRPGDQPASVAIGDLNGDGKPDLATANATADTVSVLLNRGNGTFAPRLDYPTGGAPDLGRDRRT